MKAKVLVVVVLVLVMAVLAGAVLAAPAAYTNVLWKQNCPAWADLEVIAEGMDRHIVCSVGDVTEKAK